MESVQGQGWQGEVVDELGLIVPIAEVGDIVLVGHIGLGDQGHARGSMVQYPAQELDDAVCLR